MQVPPLKMPVAKPLTMPRPYPSLLDPKIVVHYDFSRGSKLYDFSGKGNHGAITSATFVAKGKWGTALQYDGTDDYTVTAAARTDPVVVTVIAEITPDAIGGSDIGEIVSHGSKPTDNGWTFEQRTDKLRLIAHGIANTDSLAGILVAGVAQRVGFTLDTTALKFYVDGVEKSSHTITQPSVATHKISTGMLPDGTGNKYAGLIGEVIIAERVYTAMEMKNDYLAWS